MLLSIHFTLSSPLPVSISLFSMSVSPLLSCKWILQYHFSRFSIYACIRYLSFSFWLTSLCIIGTRFINLIRTDSKAFLFIAERRRIDAFELWCWRRLLRVPWTARRSNLPILKEISPGISLEGMMLKLKLQYFGHLMWRVDSLKKLWCWEGLGAGGKGGNRGWDGWIVSPTRWMWGWVNSGSWWWTGRPGMLQFMGSQRVGHNWATELIHMKVCPMDKFPGGIHKILHVG